MEEYSEIYSSGGYRMRNGKQTTPLANAIRKKEDVDYLLRDKELDINARWRDNFVEYEVVDIQKVIRDGGWSDIMKWNPEKIDEYFYWKELMTYEKTVLAVAIEVGELDIVNKLVEKGADVNLNWNKRVVIKGYLLETTPLGPPLLVAINMLKKGGKNNDIVKKLIEKGANLNYKISMDGKSRTIGEYFEEKHPDIYKEILEKNK